MESDPRAAAIERLAAAQEALTSNLAATVKELHAVDERRGIQLGSIRRLGFAQLAGLGVVLVTLLLIVSAVMPGIPVLRIHERGSAQTAKAVRDLQCTTLWANGYRLAACAPVNGALTGLTGQP